MRTRGALTAGVALLVCVGLAQPAVSQEGPSAEADGTVSVAVRSVTVSPTSFAFDECTLFGVDTNGKLAFPNGRCDGPELTVTNGESSAHIVVRATNFVGSSAPEPEWRLCGPRDCAGGGLPGAEELAVALGPHADDHIGVDDRCHTYWNVDAQGDERCAATPNQSVELTPIMIGPGTTSNGSPEFTTTITWTALP